ncbi:MAG TPA: methylated-DNA--[protein]-cysteine S-methyltransferase [Candidatus Scatomorpha gallistercoris]|nr:methylated-DNA--[protein]-cysteine S-methyltransferase [Candidatus Scatomorpha gallistercoris]
MTEREKLHAVLECDGAYDGRFFYAVRSTGVYCRPSCKSRPPKPENVEYFDSAAEAEAAGYRPCKRCRPDMPEYDPDKDTAERVGELIALHLADAQELRKALSQVGLSRAQLTRVFERRYGVPIKQYADALRIQRAKSLLGGGATATEAASAVGMDSAAFSAFFRRQTGMTPREYASRQGGGETACIVASPLGLLRIAESAKGIAGIAFAREGDAEPVRGKFIPEAKRQLDEYFAGRRREFDLPLDLRGTEFQKRVWAELMRIPYGETRSYQDVAAAIGNVKATRAVGAANNRNPVVIIIPCHRVVGKGGALTGYAGGLEKKEFLLKLEAEHAETP